MNAVVIDVVRLLLGCARVRALALHCLPRCARGMCVRCCVGRLHGHATSQYDNEFDGLFRDADCVVNRADTIASI